jgi:hypothetical protein
MRNIIQSAMYFIIIAYTPLGLALEKIPDFSRDAKIVGGADKTFSLGVTVTPECDGESHFPQKKISNDMDLCVTEESYGDFGGLSSQEADWVGEESSMVELKDYIYVSCPPVYDLEINSNPTNECKKDDVDLIDCCVLRAIVDPIDPDDISSHGPISEAGDFSPDIKPEKMPEGMRDLHDKFSGKPKPHHTFKGVKKIGDPVIPGFRDKIIPGHKPEDGEPSEESCLDIISEYAWRTEIDEATACCIVEEANSLSCFDKPEGEERDACLNGAASSCGSFGPNDLIEIRH